MGEKRINLTPAEWNIMEGLWERSPLTGREITELLEERMGWNRSTTLTLLRRLEEKGAIQSNDEGRKKVFFPIVTREEAALQETENFLERVYKGSVSMMLSAMTKKQALSKQEIDELSSQMREFGVSMNDVADNSPRQQRTLDICRKAVVYAKNNPEILEDFLRTKRVPLAKLAVGADVERKSLERHRRYLVAVLLICTNGYEIMRGHIMQVLKGGEGK